MKKFIAFLMTSLLLSAGCNMVDNTEQMNVENVNQRKTMSFKPVFGLESDIYSWIPEDGLKWTHSRSDMADYADSLLCLDYMSGTMIQKTSSPSDKPFSLTMNYGAHELKFLGHSSTDWQLDKEKALFRTEKVTETFLKCVQIEVYGGTDETMTLQMDRVVTKLTLMIMDAIPGNVSRIEMTVGGHMSAIDMNTGLGVAEEKTDFSLGWDLDGSFAGKKGLKLTVFSFCEEKEFDCSIHVKALDLEGNIISERKATGIPMLMNRCTVVKGYIFSAESMVSFNGPGEWIESKEIYI